MQCPTCDGPFDGISCTCGYERPAKASGVAFRSTEHPQPKGITRAEFGEQLYVTLGLIGGIMQLRRYRGLVAMGDLPKTDEYDQREAKLREQLATAMVALPAHDVTEILDRYPWVAAC
ncbi:MAG: hypothetical protein H8K10_01970 [Nitrospira sp.]|nr:hypothetical protein [Nitrospira sp.]